MASLPMDIVTDIFRRLPATTLLRCRVLSKPCFSLIDSPDFIASHLKRTLETEDHLMILLRSHLRLRTVYLDAPDTLSDVANSTIAEVFGSVNGVIGLTNSPLDLALFNPSTRKIHRLPVEPIDVPERYCVTREYVFYGLGYDSVSDDYKVVRMLQFRHKGEGGGYLLGINVFSLNRNKWKRIYLPFEVRIIFIYFYYQVMYRRRGNGVLASNSLHWILPRSQGDIVVYTIFRFDLASDDFGVLSLPQELYCEDDIDDMDMGVLDGCLCLMCYSEFSHVDVWILREYQGEWSKFVSVPKPETVEWFKFVRPMIYSKDRSKILLEINNGKLMWFDLASKSFETLEIKGCDEGPCNAEIVVSSLKQLYQTLIPVLVLINLTYVELKYPKGRQCA